MDDGFNYSDKPAGDTPLEKYEENQAKASSSAQVEGGKRKMDKMTMLAIAFGGVFVIMLGAVGFMRFFMAPATQEADVFAPDMRVSVAPTGAAVGSNGGQLSAPPWDSAPDPASNISPGAQPIQLDAHAMIAAPAEVTAAPNTMPVVAVPSASQLAAAPQPMLVAPGAPGLSAAQQEVTALPRQPPVVPTIKDKVPADCPCPDEKKPVAPVKRVTKAPATRTPAVNVSVPEYEPVMIDGTPIPRAGLIVSVPGREKPVPRETMESYMLYASVDGKAWIRNKNTGETLVVGVGDAIPGAGTVKAISAATDSIQTSTGIIR